MITVAIPKKIRNDIKEDDSDSLKITRVHLRNITNIFDNNITEERSSEDKKEPQIRTI